MHRIFWRFSSRRFSYQTHAEEVPTKLKYGLLAYFGVVNVGAFGLFAYDKAQAVRGGWRVRERDLQLSALLVHFPFRFNKY